MRKLLAGSSAKRIPIFVLIFSLMCVAFFAVMPETVHAAGKSTAVKVLKTNTTYELDLNGGKKEKVKLATSSRQFYLYVNGKKVYTKA